MFHKSAFLGLLLSVLCLGCGQAVETLTIEQWAMALKEKDLTTLKMASSEEFQEKALRLDESLEDFEVLNIPSGEINVVNINDVSETEKQVSVEVGPRKIKLFYTLTRQNEKDRWVVNDIFVRQRQEGLEAQRSITEQMDLLLTLREFLATWRGRNREQMLAQTTPKLRAILAQLPDEYLVGLCKITTGENEEGSGSRPLAHMDENIAVVRIKRPIGEAIISFKQLEGKWLVDDLAMESSDPMTHIPSLQKTVTALTSGIGFLDAYQKQDREKLAKCSTENFFKLSLAHADLPSLPLPGVIPPPADYKISTHPHHAELIISETERVVRVTLKRMDDPKQGDDKPISYLVEDVTIFDLKTQDKIQLSAYFTGHEVLTLFINSLKEGNVKMVQQMATPEFNERVWKKLEGKSLAGFGFLGIGRGETKLLKTSFNGAVTNIDVIHDQQPVTYELRNWNGRVLVHDVKLVGAMHPASLKDTMDVMIPVREFSNAYQNGKLDDLRRLTTRDFSRQVWDQAERIPDIGTSVAAYLQMPFHSMSVLENEALVTLGSPEQGVRVLLTKLQDRFIVDDVLLMAGPLPNQRVQLKQTLRSRMVLNSPLPQQMQQSPAAALPASPGQYPPMEMQTLPGQAPQQGVMPASGEFPSQQFPSQGVQPAYREYPQPGTQALPGQPLAPLPPTANPKSVELPPSASQSGAPVSSPGFDYSQPISPGQFPPSASKTPNAPAPQKGAPQSFLPGFENGQEEAFPALDVNLN